MSEPVISDAMAEAYRDAAAATPCPACGRVPQCRCLIPDGGRESYRVRRGLRAAIAQYLTEQSRTRCRSKIAHGSGVVLQCMERRGHAGNHLTTREQWGDHHPDEIVESTGGHVYLSTGCLHGDHGYCQSTRQGGKIPAQCKFCAAPCICHCHQAAPTEPADQLARSDPAPTGLGPSTSASAGEPEADRG